MSTRFTPPAPTTGPARRIGVTRNTSRGDRTGARVTRQPLRLPPRRGR
ncbi:hypothetical protein GA0070606_3549 [Micromonospora citrea]|uniref:Uncharacterized protein n=1 Tax=Micromonospora citrea TaxID=47855 RepID=A0A1C6V6Q4_9ACTN|nr:hypothetical protein [Micromonospora citrea]SCL62033.1 hypothetical protein GA0070606_3549 [Micromonospora citrea]